MSRDPNGLESSCCAIVCVQSLRTRKAAVFCCLSVANALWFSCFSEFFGRQSSSEHLCCNLVGTTVRRRIKADLRILRSRWHSLQVRKLHVF